MSGPNAMLRVSRCYSTDYYPLTSDARLVRLPVRLAHQEETLVRHPFAYRGFETLDLCVRPERIAVVAGTAVVS